MTEVAVNEIECQFAQLPHAAQLGVLERLVHIMRESADSRQDDLDSGFSAMANDPEMQREIRLINSEFSGTETDGLRRT